MEQAIRNMARPMGILGLAETGPWKMRGYSPPSRISAPQDYVRSTEDAF